MLPARAAAAAALLAAALLLCAGAAAAAPDHILRRDDLIGWGEVPAAGGSNPDELRRGRAPGADAGAGAAGTDPDAQRALPDPAAAAAAAAAARPRGQEILSWSPRVILFRGLLTDAECDHLVARATPRLARSGVVDEEADGEGVSDIRTSDGMFFGRGEDAVVAGVERKIAEWLLIPPGHAEGLQVLRYARGQEYRPHFDYFFHAAANDNGGNRLATALLYLSDVEEGGETIFPNAAPPDVDAMTPSARADAARLSACAAGQLAVRPRKGDAVAFFSLRPDGVLDRGALHGGCPVISGTKYAATWWAHVAPYAQDESQAVKAQHVVYAPPPPPVPRGCVDQNRACRDWAAGGECEHNPGFMVGRAGDPGRCLASCGRCDLMPA